MEEIVLRITDKIYGLYGSGSGHLFGLSPEKRPVVEAIVKATLEIGEVERV